MPYYFNQQGIRRPILRIEKRGKQKEKEISAEVSAMPSTGGQ
jgi:hypothetical protein